MAETAYSKTPTAQVESAWAAALIQVPDESLSKLRLSASYLDPEPNAVPMDADACRLGAICLRRTGEGPGSSPLSSRRKSSISSGDNLVGKAGDDGQSFRRRRSRRERQEILGIIAPVAGERVLAQIGPNLQISSISLLSNVKKTSNRPRVCPPAGGKS